MNRRSTFRALLAGLFGAPLLAGCRGHDRQKDEDAEAWGGDPYAILRGRGPCQRCGAAGTTYYAHAGEIGRMICFECRLFLNAEYRAAHPTPDAPTRPPEPTHAELLSLLAEAQIHLDQWHSTFGTEDRCDTERLIGRIFIALNT